LEQQSTPSKRLSHISPKESELATTGANQPGPAGIGRVEPRLETARKGFSLYANLVAEFASKYMKVELMDWQLYAIDGVFEAESDTGDLINRAALISVARQNGKTVLGQACIGAWLTSIAKLRGKPQTVVNSAHELSLAVRQFEVVAPILQEYFGATLKRAYGRNTCDMPDGSRWLVKAATPSAGMGLSADFIWVDEVYAVEDNVLAHSLRPTMKARNMRTAGGSPIMLMTSTAGTEASVAMLRYREQGLQLIDDKRQGQFYFAEWSPPPGVDVMDTRWWGWANPALGVTLDLESLLADAEHPDRSSFLRGSLNQFVNADACWLQPGEWEQCMSDIPGPEGGWIAVDTSIDGSRYSAVRAAVDDVGVAHITVEFVVGSLPEMQQALLKACENPSVMLAVTPPLENHVPLSLERRKKVVGYGELMRYTSLVKGMINDGRLVHQGQQNLAEQMNRAVAVTQQNSLVISSKRSPGPVELARLTIFAAALASRPKQGGKPMLVVVNR
jgi:phage terminase large subunit-like protein